MVDVVFGDVGVGWDWRRVIGGCGTVGGAL